MRSLNFTKPEHYKYIYIAAIANTRYELSPTERRTHARLMTTLETIGDKGNGDIYELNKNGISGLFLEEAEFSLLKKLVELFPWPPADSRMVVEIEDWLATIKEGAAKPQLLTEAKPQPIPANGRENSP